MAVGTGAKVGAGLLVLTAGVMLVGNPLGGKRRSDHDDRRTIRIEATGSADRILVSAVMRSNTRGIIYNHPHADERDPWAFELEVGPLEVVEVVVEVWSNVVVGRRTRAGCVIRENGVRRDRDTNTPRLGSAQVECHRVLTPRTH